MSFLLICPACGTRRVDEFRFGGEARARPAGPLPPRDWRAYLYERANVAGPQREWWYHRQGCKRWFVATRDTRTNAVLATGWSGEEAGGEDEREERDTHATATTGDADAVLG